MADERALEGAAQNSGIPQNPVEGKRASPWKIPLITAAALVAAFCAYYFVYVDARRAELANRNFRALALLGEEIQQSVTIHDNILDYFDSLLNKTHSGHIDKLAASDFL